MRYITNSCDASLHIGGHRHITAAPDLDVDSAGRTVVILGVVLWPRSYSA